MRWLSALSDPLASPIFVDTSIEDDSKQAMLRSMAILRGETDKIDLSLHKYTTDLITDPAVVGLLGPSMAVPANVAPQATGTKKYDAFKHRSFIYDDEDGNDDTILSPGLLAMGAGATPAVKLRSNSADSDGVDFQPTYPSTATPSAVHHAATTEEEEQEVSEDVEYAAEGGEGSEDGDSQQEEQESSESASANEYDPEDELQDGDDAEEGDDGEQGAADGAEGATTSDSAAAAGAAAEGEGKHADGTGDGKLALYKLTGGKKTHAARAPKDPKPLSHTNSGNLLEAPTYKVATHSRYQKGGDSWIKKDSPGGATLGTHAKTPAKGPQPKQIIPTSDAKQPLARRHSNMIHQCKCV